MGLLKGAADLVYTFRFIRMLVMNWESWDAYKEGIKDKNGKRIKSVKLDSAANKDAYNRLIKSGEEKKRI